MTIPDYHKETIAKYPANEWVKPNFDVFVNLFEWGLVERKIENHYKGKNFVGSTHYFKHNIL